MSMTSGPPVATESVWCQRSGNLYELKNAFKSNNVAMHLLSLYGGMRLLVPNPSVKG